MIQSTFLSRYQRQNSNYHILLVVINVNTKYAYAIALKEKTQETVLNELDKIRSCCLAGDEAIFSLKRSKSHNCEFVHFKVKEREEMSGGFLAMKVLECVDQSRGSVCD